jgi:hypothetical protein
MSQDETTSRDGIEQKTSETTDAVTDASPTPPPEPAKQRKPYTPPSLTLLGTVKDMTLGAGGSNTDGLGGQLSRPTRRK